MWEIRYRENKWNLFSIGKVRSQVQLDSLNKPMDCVSMTTVIINSKYYEYLWMFMNFMFVKMTVTCYCFTLVRSVIFCCCCSLKCVSCVITETGSDCWGLWKPGHEAQTDIEEKKRRKRKTVVSSWLIIKYYHVSQNNSIDAWQEIPVTWGFLKWRK